MNLWFIFEYELHSYEVRMFAQTFGLFAKCLATFVNLLYKGFVHTDLHSHEVLMLTLMMIRLFGVYNLLKGIEMLYLTIGFPDVLLS